METNMTNNVERHLRPGQAYAELQRTIRRPELKLMVPLADSTIYEMEQRGEFPRRFSLSPRCVVWDLAEVHVWLDARRAESRAGKLTPSHPNVRLRRTRPVKD
jgi:prophage regulatory protein